MDAMEETSVIVNDPVNDKKFIMGMKIPSFAENISFIKIFPI